MTVKSETNRRMSYLERPNFRIFSRNFCKNAIPIRQIADRALQENRKFRGYFPANYARGSLGISLAESGLTRADRIKTVGVQIQASSHLTEIQDVPVD